MDLGKLGFRILIIAAVLFAARWVLKKDSAVPIKTDKVAELPPSSGENLKIAVTRTHYSDAALERQNGQSEIHTASPREEKTQMKVNLILTSLGKCLDVKSVQRENVTQLRRADLVDSVKNEMGLPVSDSEDWRNIHLVLPNKEERRIRIEMESDETNQVNRTVKYYGVDAEKLPIEIPLPKEMTKNPKDQDLLALENKGEVVLREKGGKVYFRSGEIMNFVEKDDVLTDFEFNRRGHIFKCSQLEEQQPSCQCL